MNILLIAFWLTVFYFVWPVIVAALGALVYLGVVLFVYGFLREAWYHVR